MLNAVESINKSKRIPVSFLKEMPTFRGKAKDFKTYMDKLIKEGEQIVQRNQTRS